MPEPFLSTTLSCQTIAPAEGRREMLGQDLVAGQRAQNGNLAPLWHNGILGEHRHRTSEKNPHPRLLETRNMTDI
jgi:hypothetical protein